MTDASVTERGLSEAEAKARLAADGPNELPGERRFDWAGRVLGPLREPAYQLLIAAGAVYLALGDRLEGALLFVVAVLAVAISIVQDYRTERTLTRLRDLSSPRALVRRDGVEKRIPARELVAGDIVILNEGDRAPADGTLIAAHGLAADESLMTGESVPVEKFTGRAETAGAGATAPDFVLGGSLIVKGAGAMRATATGPRSQLGRIGVAIAGARFEPPRLTVHMRRIVRLFATAAIAACLLLVLSIGLQSGEWLPALLLGLALAIALAPEEIPLVTTAFTVVGALRIARAGVLARQAGAIETLGEMTVLCLDKTGTLTQNRMALAGVWTPAGGFREARDAPGNADDLLRIAADACASDTSDPMERAILRARPEGGTARRPDKCWPFDRAVMAMGNFYCRNGETLFAAKGAPETVIPWAEPDAARAKTALDAAEDMAARGMRVIAVAHGAPPPEGGALTQARVRLDGLVGLADPLRPEAPGLIEECAGAGVRIIMMTGDHPVTAAAIARQAGLAHDGAVVEGAAFAAMEEDERAALIETAAVFARVVPEQKLSIVHALKDAGEIVAMTGDGVNDAPALKAAHIGVAMGERGSDVAREAASLVLVHDDLASLVHAVRLGRRIGDNIRKALAYIFSVHVVIAGAALIPVLTGMPPLLLPLHVVILEFIIDPVCAIVMEADRAEKDAMRRPPRRPDQPLFGIADIVANALLGGAALGGVIAAYSWAMTEGGADAARATAFFVIMTMNAALILLTRAQGGRLVQLFGTGNPFLWPVVILVLLAGAAVTHLPPLASMLGFAPPRLDIVAICAGGAIAAMLSVEMAMRLAGGARRRARGLA